MSEDSELAPETDAPEIASRPKRGPAFPRLDHPHNLTLNALRGEDIARVLLTDGAIVGFETVEGDPKTSAADILAMTAALAGLAGEFGWDLSGDKTFHLRTQRVAARQAAAPQPSLMDETGGDDISGEASDE